MRTVLPNTYGFCVQCPTSISTRILGRRTALFSPFLIPNRAPAWCYPKILVLMHTCVQCPTKLVVVPGPRWFTSFGNAKRYWYVLPAGLSA